MADTNQTTAPKTDRDAHDIWARMVALWESKPALEAVREMALTLKREGWIDVE